MPLEVTCAACSGRFRVPDTAAGKRIKCPKCKSVIEVPGAAVISTALGETWTLKTDDGNDYGPVPRPELDQWFQEGRITADCQLLRTGAAQWQWATDVYPELAAPSAGSELFINTGEVRPGASRVASKTGSSIAKKGVRGRGPKGPRSPVITYLSYASYVIGGMQAFVGLMFMLGGAGVAAAFTGIEASHDDAEVAGAAAGVMTAFFVGMGVFVLVLSVPSFLAGYGLSLRKQWGRILTLVLGGLSLPNIPLGTAYGIWVFMVLLDKKYASEFH